MSSAATAASAAFRSSSFLVMCFTRAFEIILPMMGTPARIGGLKTIMGFLLLTSVVPLWVKKKCMKIMAPAQSAPISAQISDTVL
eukprot:scaffold84200_cov61-Phaeocystis_antarctica.AAC.3